jgi:hypothetical protein
MLHIRDWDEDSLLRSIILSPASQWLLISGCPTGQRQDCATRTHQMYNSNGSIYYTEEPSLTAEDEAQTPKSQP